MEDEKLLDKMRHILAENHLPTSEQEMIQNIFAYADKDAKDIMTHRKNIIAIEANETLEDAVRFVVEESNSRFPIYEEDIDNIIGTVHVKDMMKCYLDESVRNQQVKEVANLIRPVRVVPETKDIDALFKLMQRNKTHMVIVLDEYGMTSGLVTLEDIIEEIMGNIMDEYDEEEEKITLQSDGTYIVPGLTELEDLEELLPIEFEEEDFDTLNGFLVDALDHIPAEDEVCHVDYSGYRFYVQEVNDNIIQTVKIEKVNEQC